MQNSSFPETGDVERLLSLQHGDRGFFVVALYAFIECYLRKRYALSYEEARFGDLVNRLIEGLQGERTVGIYGVGQLSALDRNHEDWKDRKSARELSRELETSAARIAELSGFRGKSDQA